MGVEIVEELSPVGGAKPSVGNARATRGQIHETITVDTGGGGRASEPVRDDSRSRVEHETITVGKHRVGLPESARKMLDNIDKHGTVSDDPPDSPPAAAGTPDAGAAPPPASPGVEVPAAATAVSTPAPEADPAKEHIERADRLAEHNRKLVAEVETLRASGAKREPSKREKMLDEAARMWVEDNVGAIRRLAAVGLDLDDPAAEAVGKHLSWAYQDLTERELGVPLDPQTKSTREQERIKLMLERDRRDRAQPTTPTPSPDEQTFANHARLVGEFQAAAKHAEKFPLLIALSQDFDSQSPNELVLREIRRGFETGEYDRRTNDDVLIETASRRLEAKYQVLADKIVKARPQTAASTATPTQAAVATDRNAAPQETGHRTITNASASVAPATSPAAKPAPTDEPQKKPWRNEKERIKQLIAKHSGESIR